MIDYCNKYIWTKVDGRKILPHVDYLHFLCPKNLKTVLELIKFSLESFKKKEHMVLRLSQKGKWGSLLYIRYSYDNAITFYM